jgi:hypothetical protein
MDDTGYDVLELVEDLDADALEGMDPEQWEQAIASITGSSVEDGRIVPTPAIRNAARFVAAYLTARDADARTDALYRVEMAPEAIEQEACRTFVCGHPVAWEIAFNDDWEPIEDGAEPYPGFLVQHWQRWRDR